MDSSDLNEVYKLGYIEGVTSVLKVILEEMDNELKERVLNNLKLKEYE